MTLNSQAGFRAFVSSLPGTSIVEQWKASVAKVGGKVFCLLADSDSSLAFKVSETSFEGLAALPGIGQAAYFAKGQWVRVERGALDEETLVAYIEQAHRIIAAKLSRRDRAELGL